LSKLVHNESSAFGGELECFHGFIIPLDFAGKLDGTSDVPAVQVELWVEVLVGCDGCRVVRTGTLGHVTLTETQRKF